MAYYHVGGLIKLKEQLRGKKYVSPSHANYVRDFINTEGAPYIPFMKARLKTKGRHKIWVIPSYQHLKEACEFLGYNKKLAEAYCFIKTEDMDLLTNAKGEYIGTEVVGKERDYGGPGGKGPHKKNLNLDKQEEIHNKPENDKNNSTMVDSTSNIIDPQVQRFEHGDNDFWLLARIIDGEPWFPASETARVLGYENPRDAILNHCRNKGVVNHDTLTKGGNQRIKYINEPSLYRLIMRSNLSSASKFQDWVVEDVLPSIRKTGRYEQKAQPKDRLDMLAGMIDEMRDQRDRLKSLEEMPNLILKEVKPQVQNNSDIHADAPLTKNQREQMEQDIFKRACSYYKCDKVSGMIRRDLKETFLAGESASQTRWYMIPQKEFLNATLFVKKWKLKERDRDSVINWWEKTKAGHENMIKYGFVNLLEAIRFINFLYNKDENDRKDKNDAPLF